MVTKQIHLGVLLYGCGHHQAAWMMPDSSIEKVGKISYYQSLAQLAEKGYFDAIFLRTTKHLKEWILVKCLPFGLTRS